MKKEGIQKISLEKLTITKLNKDMLQKITGGTSEPTLPSNVIPLDGDFINLCDPHIK